MILSRGYDSQQYHKRMVVGHAAPKLDQADAFEASKFLSLELEDSHEELDEVWDTHCRSGFDSDEHM